MSINQVNVNIFEWNQLYMKGKSRYWAHQLNIYLTVDCPANFRIWPPNFIKAYLKIPLQNLRSKFNSTLILKIQFYVDSENFVKKYWNPIEFYCFERNQLFEYHKLRYGRFSSFFCDYLTICYHVRLEYGFSKFHHPRRRTPPNAAAPVPFWAHRRRLTENGPACITATVHYN